MTLYWPSHNSGICQNCGLDETAHDWPDIIGVYGCSGHVPLLRNDGGAVTARNTLACNELERLLRRGNIRQARRQFERKFAERWPNIEPDPQRHPRLCIVIARYRERLEATK